MKVLDKAVSRVTGLGTVLGAVGLLIVMSLVVASVVARSFGSAVPGSYELTQLIITVTISFSLAHTALKNGHVTVELFVTRLPARVRVLATILVSALSFAFWALIAYAGIRFAVDKGLREVSETLDVPHLPFRALLALGMLLLALSYASHIAKSSREPSGDHDLVGD
ncbi:MAG: TRAP transporter small permease [Thermoleophilia bacterium]